MRSEDTAVDSEAKTDDECGCAPSPRERRLLWPARATSLELPTHARAFSRRHALGLGVLSVAALTAVGGSLLVPPAYAQDYPSWDDVQKARANEAAKAAEIQRIEGLIKSLADDLAVKQAAAKAAADEFYVAQQEFFAAAYRADQLQAQADAEAAKATDAANKAGRVAAQLYRKGGEDTSLELFFSGSAATADNLLARLGTMDKLLERNSDVYANAIAARDSAQNLSDLAELQRAERDRLQQIAEEKMIASQEAADAAQAALALQQEHKVELDAQLAALKDTTAKTVADYEAGVEAARKAEEERKAKERAEAERLAKEQAASGGGNGGAVGGAGWARPSSGWRSSGYGPRTVQCGSGYCSSGFHYGVDLATGCGSAIYAASSGTVVYAGWNGGYGNYIKIDHGGGIGTGYGHIMNGGIYVGYGQWVNAGQVIAAEGNTGNSFGCHVHFETYVNGGTVNPIDFMAARGISV